MSAPTSKAVIAAAASGNRWHQKRIHRRLDDRDTVLDAALETVENWDSAVFPAVTKVTGFAYNKASGASNVDVFVTGAAFTDDSVVQVTLGGTAITGLTLNVAQQRITLPGAQVNTITDDALNPIGTQLMLMVRIDGVLCPPVAMTVLLA
jgi:hypothetical protein